MSMPIKMDLPSARVDTQMFKAFLILYLELLAADIQLSLIQNSLENWEA